MPTYFDLLPNDIADPLLLMAWKLQFKAVMDQLLYKAVQYYFTEEVKWYNPVYKSRGMAHNRKTNITTTYRCMPLDQRFPNKLVKHSERQYLEIEKNDFASYINQDLSFELVEYK